MNGAWIPGNEMTAEKLNQTGFGFTPHEQDTPDLTLYVEPGVVILETIVVKHTGGNSPSFTAPAANPRIDLLTIDSAGTLARVAGAEAGSPTAPAYPENRFVICEIYNRVGQTSVKNDDDSSNGYILRISKTPPAASKLSLIHAVFGGAVAVTSGDGKLYLRISEALDGKTISAVGIQEIVTAAGRVPPSFANLGASTTPDFANGTPASSFASSSWTPPTSGLICLFVHSNKNAGGGSPATPTVSGNGLTWVQIATVVFNTNQRVTLFAANASGSSAGATTISFGGESQSDCITSFFHVLNTDVANGVAQCFVQSPTATGSSTTPTVNLSAAGNAGNRPICGIGTSIGSQGTAVTPRTNWTEADDLASPDAGLRLESQYRSDAFETTASGTGPNQPWGIIAAEIKAANQNIAVQIARGRQAGPTSDFTYSDVLSTPLSIDAGEYDSKDATIPAVIDTSNDDLEAGDVLRVDVDAVSSGIQGLNISIDTS